MKYLSVCSGIEAASVAWHPFGWRAFALSEIERFPCAVLAHHYPDVPNLGDMTKFQEWPDAAIDVLVGGTPCQSFSVAGLRKGLADPRGNLMLTYLAIAARYRPAWLVWENVPGVLSSNGGIDFACLLQGLAELGYGFAYRVLDAQHFGVPQRRRRVFVVGCLGDWRRAAAVLFERHSLQGNPAPRREAREAIAGSITAGARKCDHAGSAAAGLIASTGNISHCLNAGGMGRQDYESETLIAFNARQDPDSWVDRTGPIDTDGSTQAIAFSCKDHAADAADTAPTLRAMGHSGSHANAGGQVAVAFGLRSDAARSGEAKNPSLDAEGKSRLRDAGFNIYEETSPTLDAGRPHSVGTLSAVRRLTPRECERLQGFPDDYTLIQVRGKPAADGPRYKALGNSMAVPVMRWIGERIQAVSQVPAQECAA